MIIINNHEPRKANLLSREAIAPLIGIPIEAPSALEMPARRMRIEPSNDGTFQTYPEAPFTGCVIPACDIDGNHFDDIAFFNEDPFSWYIRRLDAAYIGAHALEYARFNSKPVLLVETPLEWLKVQGWAVVILDWNRVNTLTLFQLVPAVICINQRLRDRFERLNSELARPKFEISNLAGYA